MWISIFVSADGRSAQGEPFGWATVQLVELKRTRHGRPDEKWIGYILHMKLIRHGYLYEGVFECVPS